jgi:2'-5' RNA ligase
MLPFSMPRLFVGIDLPDALDERLELMSGGIPGARWEGGDKLHLTLRFLGTVDGGVMRAAVDALSEIEHERFPMELAGVGVFPPRGKPRIVWVGVGDSSALRVLKGKVDRALSDLDVDPERRKFSAHVTLARLRNAPVQRVADFLAHNALFRAEPFDVQAFRLYSSVLSPAGSKYRVEAAFPLGPPNTSGTGHDRSIS